MKLINVVKRLRTTRRNKDNVTLCIPFRQYICILHAKLGISNTDSKPEEFGIKSVDFKN